MSGPVPVVQMVIRGLGVVVLVLGILIWTGNAYGLLSLHRLLGILLVLSLWTLAYLAFQAGVNRGLVIFAIAWGLLAPIVGVSQDNLVQGSAHWVVQVLHLLIGLGVIGLGEILGVRAKRGGRSAPARI